MKTHTPGPWRVYESKGSSRLRIMSDAVPYDVATMSHAGGEEAEAANAMLIAAAPEMLEALRHLVEKIETYAEWASREKVADPTFNPMPLCDLILESVRSHGVLGNALAAIARAEGRA